MTERSREEVYADAMDDVTLALEFYLDGAKRVPIPPTVDRLANAFGLLVLLLGYLAKAIEEDANMSASAIVRDYITNYTKRYFEILELLQNNDPPS